jgi:hypothetical protein
VCRALVVLCVASDRESLVALKRASVSAEWELAPGATMEDDAVAQVEEERPHVMVVFGDFPTLVERAHRAMPSLRVVADRPHPGAIVVGSVDDVRTAIKGAPRPGGPVR